MITNGFTTVRTANLSAGKLVCGSLSRVSLFYYLFFFLLFVLILFQSVCFLLLRSLLYLMDLDVSGSLSVLFRRSRPDPCTHCLQPTTVTLAGGEEAVDLCRGELVLKRVRKSAVEALAASAAVKANSRLLSDPSELDDRQRTGDKNAGKKANCPTGRPAVGAIADEKGFQTAIGLDGTAFSVASLIIDRSATLIDLRRYTGEGRGRGEI